MPQLEDCNEQQQYRTRCETETEAVCHTITNMNNSDSPLRIKLMSLKTKDTAKIRFHNMFERQVRALWMDFEGHEVTFNFLFWIGLISGPRRSHFSMHACMQTHSPTGRDSPWLCPTGSVFCFGSRRKQTVLDVPQSLLDIP